MMDAARILRLAVRLERATDGYVRPGPGKDLEIIEKQREILNQGIAYLDMEAKLLRSEPPSDDRFF